MSEKIYDIRGNVHLYPLESDLVLSAFFHNFYVPIDRFGTMPVVDKKYDIYYDKLPKFTTDTFYDCCLKRAQQLVDRGKEIIIFSSGGVDSITMIAAFALLGYSKQIKVIQIDGIETDMNIVNFIKSKGIDYSVHRRLDYNLIKDALIIEGTGGGPISLISEDRGIFIERSPEFYANFKKHLKDEAMEEIRLKAFMPLLDTGELMWYIGFVYGVRHAASIHANALIYGSSGIEHDLNNIEPFFYCSIFDDYAYTNHEHFRGVTEYKPAYKNFIRTAFGDSDLITNLQKGNSVQLTFETNCTISNRFLMTNNSFWRKYSDMTVYIDDSGKKTIRLGENGWLSGRKVLPLNTQQV